MPVYHANGLDAADIHIQATEVSSSTMLSVACLPPLCRCDGCAAGFRVLEETETAMYVACKQFAKKIRTCCH